MTSRYALALAALALPVCATVATTVSSRGYLLETVDIAQVVPPPPQKGDPRYEADRKVFRLTRRMLETPRGRLATEDVPFTMPDLMRDFSCAAGVVLSPKTTPATYNLLVNADADTARANEAAKVRWKRLRPFQIDRGPVCQNKNDLAGSYDYPSGHTTHGWTIGLILADLNPDRASQILARARAYGESRVVCGAHNLSAIEAARLGATVSLQQVRQSPRYLSDFSAAIDEIKNKLFKSEVKLNEGICVTEQSLLSPSILEDLRGSDARP